MVVGAYKTLTLPVDEGRYSADFWIDQTVLGIAQGAILALIALGYTLVYGILRMINFAHGEVFMAGAFISFFFADAYAKSGFLNSNPYLALFILLVVSVAISTLVAVLLERIAYRPLRNAPRLVPLITAIGASLFIANAFRGFFGPQPYGYPQPTILAGEVEIFGIAVGKIAARGAGDIGARDDGAAVLRASQPHGSVDARRRRGQRDREPDGHQRRSHRGDHLRHRRRACGGGRACCSRSPSSRCSSRWASARASRPSRPRCSAGSAASAARRSVDSSSACSRRCGPPLLLTGYGVPSPFSLRDAFVFLVLVLVLVFRPGGLLGSGDAEKV